MLFYLYFYISDSHINLCNVMRDKAEGSCNKKGERARGWLAAGQQISKQKKNTMNRQRFDPIHIYVYCMDDILLLDCVSISDPPRTCASHAVSPLASAAGAPAAAAKLIRREMPQDLCIDW